MRWLLLPLLIGCSGRSPEESAAPAPEGATVEGLRVAFLGDQGLGLPSYGVLQLIRDENVDLVVHSGDFDYADDPEAWMGQIDSVLPDMPYLASAGNHDVAEWPGYQDLLEERAARTDGLVCDGVMGVATECRFQGLHVLLSGAGLLPGGDGDWLQAKLDADDSIWSVCSWHLNMQDMQVGEKGDEAGWPAYQACQAGGGIIATGHEHSYSRTYTLTDVGNAANGHGAVGEPDAVEVGPGRSFVFVSGLGGASLRDYHPELHDDDTWWASYYTANKYVKNGVEIEDFDITWGVLFVDFWVDGDPNKARGYAKNLRGDLVDEFTITSLHGR